MEPNETMPEEEPSEEESAEISESSPEMAFSWEASEFVHHHKSALWYTVLVAAVLLLAVVAAYFHYWLEIGLFPLMGATIIVYARKPPRTLLYELSVDGIHIDGRLYPFNAFRSFSVSQEPEWHSIDLEPVQRFSPRVAVLFDTDDYDEIVGHLELHLPREDREPDMIERITRFVRF